MPRDTPTAKVFRIDLQERLRPLEVEPRYREAVLVVFSRGRVVGQVVMPALSVVPADLQRAFIGRQLGGALWEQELEELFLQGVGAWRPAEEFPQPPVSVVVCTRDRPDDLERCLESLLHVEPVPYEILVVDSCPSTDLTERLCARYPVRYVREPLPGAARARNRGIGASSGEVLAFTDDDCVVEPGWLRELGRRFADPRVSAVTGVVVPLELETPAQYLFEAHGGFKRGFARRVFDGADDNHAQAAAQAGVSANVAVRRRAFEDLGPFCEWLGPGTPARAAEDYDLFCRILEAGDKIVFDPAQVVWHRHRDSPAALRRVLFGYGVSGSAFATQRIVVDRDLGAARMLGWWWFEHVPGDLRAAIARRPERVPARLALVELAATLAGPWTLWRSRRGRRRIEPIAIAPPPEAPAEPVVVSAGGQPGLSVVVPSRNRQASLGRLLRCLGEQTYPVERFEVVVVLDGSSDESAALVRALDVPYRLRLLDLPHAGVAAARNAGAAAAGEAVVVFLDDDLVPAPGCLAAHAAAHARGDADVALGYSPPVVAAGWWGLVVRAWWEDHFRRKGEPGHRAGWMDVVTLNSSLPRELLVAAGGFDEAFASRHEDWELGVRLARRGARLAYRPAAVAHHHLDASFAAALVRQRDEARADVLLARTHPDIGLALPLGAHATDQRRTVDERDVAKGAARTARLERQRRRGQWRRLTRRLMNDAYTLGLRDAIPSDESFTAFMAELASRPPTSLAVPLGSEAPPPVPGLGRVELALTVDGRPVARLPASEPGRPWDWETALARVRRDASDDVRAAILDARLAPQATASQPELLEVARVD